MCSCLKNVYTNHFKSVAKGVKGKVVEEKEGKKDSDIKSNINHSNEPEPSSATRRPSQEGRRLSRGLEILGIGATSQRGNSPRIRSPNATTSRTREAAHEERKFKYWMMVDWTPEVKSYKYCKTFC